MDELLPQGPVRLLFLLLPDADRDAEALMPLARELRKIYPQAAFVRAQARTADELAGEVRAQQMRFAVVNPDTALVGFGEGATLALEAADRFDGLVGRVLAFGGRYARLPQRAPALTGIHLFHGEEDVVVPVAHAREAYEHLAKLYGDITLDIASKVGHGLHPALVARAISRLQACVPLRTWRRALGLGD